MIKKYIIVFMAMFYPCICGADDLCLKGNSGVLYKIGIPKLNGKILYSSLPISGVVLVPRTYEGHSSLTQMGIIDGVVVNINNRGRNYYSIRIKAHAETSRFYGGYGNWLDAWKDDLYIDRSSPWQGLGWRGNKIIVPADKHWVTENGDSVSVIDCKTEFPTESWSSQTGF